MRRQGRLLFLRHNSKESRRCCNSQQEGLKAQIILRGLVLSLWSLRNADLSRKIMESLALVV